MNLSEKNEIILEENILSLFNREMQETLVETSLEIEEISEEVLEEDTSTKRLLVTESMFPDQSLYILEEQLNSLKSSLSRIKFYMGDINDLIPH